MKGAHYNRNARRGGGDRRARIVIGESTGAQPVVSLQCFEARHRDCTGHNTLFGGACECRCHCADTTPASPEG